MNNSNDQKTIGGAAPAQSQIQGPFTPVPAQDAVTTRPPAAKGDDDLMSQPVKKS